MECNLFKDKTMPDLSLEACHNFWQNYKDKSVHKVIIFMESLEDWTLDHNTSSDLDKELEKIGKSLDKIGGVEITSPEKVIKICAYIKTSRFLRILQAIDSASPGSASKVILKAEELDSTNTAASLFLKRNILFERLRIISRIFSEDRLQELTAAYE